MQPYTFLTGVTGLLGRYLIKDLMLHNIPVAVLVRPARRATGRQRVESLMQYWEEQLGRKLPRPVVLEGDITEPDLGLDPRSSRWVAEHCDTMLHNAASLTFQATSDVSEPYRSNVEGTRHVLELCRNARIRKFHHVSTAYVCGLREGTILESELDVGQTLSNDYEKSKVQAEKMVRSADFIDSLTVFRPAIIIGDSHTGFTTTYHGFYAPIQLVHTMTQQFTADETGHYRTKARFPMCGYETKNLIPVDWVSAVTTHVIANPEHHDKTYHLTPRHPITIRLLADVLEAATKLCGVDFVGKGVSNTDLTEYEVMFRDMISIYSSYWRDDPKFDFTNTTAAAPHLPCPHVDRAMLLKMAHYAIQANFGTPRVKPVQPVIDAAKVLEPLTENDTSLSVADSQMIKLGLRIQGNGGGDWQLIANAAGNILSAEIGLDADSHSLVELDIDLFASLMRGEITPAAALTAADWHPQQNNGHTLAPTRVATLLQSLVHTAANSLVS